MALLKSKVNEIPADAIILSEEDALKYQTKILKNWNHLSDVWAFRYGGTLLASLSAVAGIYINNHYRLKLKLFRYGQMATYLPICVIPALMSFVLHTEFVLPGVVLQDGCPVCLEMRASALQATVGCVFPAILAPPAAYSIALRYSTYNVPFITQEPMKVFQLWKKQTKPISNILFAIFIGQALVASAVTYLEAKSVEKVNDRLMLMGYDLENESA